MNVKPIGPGLLSRGTSMTSLSGALQPDERRLARLLFTMFPLVGVIFLALALLHLLHDVPSQYAFYAYIGIFFLLETVAIIGWLCIYLKERPSSTDEEKVVNTSCGEKASYGTLKS